MMQFEPLSDGSILCCGYGESFSDETKGVIRKGEDGYCRFYPVATMLTCKECMDIAKKLSELNVNGENETKC